MGSVADVACVFEGLIGYRIPELKEIPIVLTGQTVGCLIRVTTSGGVTYGPIKTKCLGDPNILLEKTYSTFSCDVGFYSIDFFKEYPGTDFFTDRQGAIPFGGLREQWWSITYAGETLEFRADKESAKLFIRSLNSMFLVSDLINNLADRSKFEVGGVYVGPKDLGYLTYKPAQGVYNLGGLESLGSLKLLGTDVTHAPNIKTIRRWYEHKDGVLFGTTPIKVAHVISIKGCVEPLDLGTFHGYDIISHMDDCPVKNLAKDTLYTERGVESYVTEELTIALQNFWECPLEEVVASLGSTSSVFLTPVLRWRLEHG